MKITKIPPAPVEQHFCLGVTAFELEVIFHCLAHVSQATEKSNQASRTAAKLFRDIENAEAVSFGYGRVLSHVGREALILSVKDGAVLPKEETK